MAIIFTPNRLLIGFNELGTPSCCGVDDWPIAGCAVVGVIGKPSGFSGLFATKASIEKDFRFSSVDEIDFGDERSGVNRDSG